MKNNILILLFMFLSGSAWSQTPWYYGGKADGHAAEGVTNFTPGALAHQAMYEGHIGDGASMYEYNTFAPTNLPHFTIFQGYRGDGSSMSELNTFSQSVIDHYVAYFGGKGDGWSNQLATGFALPIVLLSFDGSAKSEHNELRWVTVMEESVDYFLLEKSRDANHFSTVAEVDAKGNSNVESKYNYDDVQDIKGVNYYRLQMTDNDKKFTYSKIIRLVNEHLDYAITVAPNPATDNIRLSFSKALSAASRLVIYDMNGKIVISSVIQKDESVKNINISSLSSGKFIIVLNTENENVSFPFIKQ